MPNVVIYNNSTKAVQQILYSVDEQPYLSRVGTDVLIQPDIPSCAQSLMKVDGGIIREWTQEEKDADQLIRDNAFAAKMVIVNQYLTELSGSFVNLEAAITTRTADVVSWNAITTPTPEQLKYAVVTVANDVIGLATFITTLKPLFTELSTDWINRQSS
jgi:hypothetical protein